MSYDNDTEPPYDLEQGAQPRRDVMSIGEKCAIRRILFVLSAPTVVACGDYLITGKTDNCVAWWFLTCGVATLMCLFGFLKKKEA